MINIERERFLHYYGQRGARLNRNDSVHTEVILKRRTYLFVATSPVLFFLPHKYIKKFDNMFIDGMINETPWNTFWKDLKTDWDRFLTPVRTSCWSPESCRL